MVLQRHRPRRGRCTKATDKQISAAVPVVREPSPVIHDGVRHRYAQGVHHCFQVRSAQDCPQRSGRYRMTVTQVMGCGIQKGTSEKYRGVLQDTTLLPKIKVGGDRLQDQRGRCGGGCQEGTVHRHIGDGKILVYNVTSRGQDPHRRRGLCRPAGCGVKLPKLNGNQIKSSCFWCTKKGAFAFVLLVCKSCIISFAVLG